MPSRIGRYELATRIAVGGMAEVFRATLPMSAGGDRSVVIKRMLPELLEHPESVRMFHDEGELGRHIRHPNVVEVLETGLDGGAPFIVLEYVFGVDLRRLSRALTLEGQLLDPQLALFIGTEMLRGLEAVHSAVDAAGVRLGVVHRDVSPSNIFLSVHGQVKLGDLGIAQAVVREASRRPVRREAKGKLGYTAPESLESADVDARADVFAAAVVIGELLLGRPLFGGATELAVLLSIRDGDTSALDELTSRCPDALVSALRHGLATSPLERVATAAALRDSLIGHLRGTPDQLAKQLGRLVVHAMEGGQSAPFDRGALARTVEADRHMLAALGELQTPTPVVARDVVDDLDGRRYELRDGERTFDPMVYADVIRCLVSDEISSRAEIRVEGSDWRALDSFPDLARHLMPSARTPTRLRVQMARTTELHDLLHANAVEVFAQAFARRLDGMLLFEHEGTRKEVYLHEGKPVFVSSNQPSDLLGRRLVDAGLLEPAALDFALSMMPRFEGRLGETLVALGLVEPIPLFRHISQQVREKVIELFTWTEGRVAYYDEIELPGSGFRLDVDAWSLFDAGIERRLGLGIPEDPRFSKPSQRVAARPPGPEPLGLGPLVTAVWQHFAVARPLSELESAFPDAARARRATHLLLALELLAWVA